jgi:hypothetical protein
MVETELLISFDKLMKKIAVFLFIKELKYKIIYRSVFAY